MKFLVYIRQPEFYILRTRIAARLFTRLSNNKFFYRMIKILLSFKYLEFVYIRVVGYHRIFKTLLDANAAILLYSNGGHSNKEATKHSLQNSGFARPSDYAAMFYLAKTSREIYKVFDAGGNIGNLYILYNKYLELNHVNWTVFDLPSTIAIGISRARTMNYSQLSFTSNWQDGEGCDLLIASGSLHYFSQPLIIMLAEYKFLPRYLLINRTPLIEGQTAATVQDTGTFRVACALYNRTSLIEGLIELGYRIIDSWDVPELSLLVPGFPEQSAKSYTGLWLRHDPSIYQDFVPALVDEIP